jgi:hypothetical protein
LTVASSAPSPIAFRRLLIAVSNYVLARIRSRLVPL